MYLEVAYGSGSSDTVEVSVVSGVTSSTYGEFSLDDLTGGRITVGWTLPENRGRFALTMNGFAENSYLLEATGDTSEVVSLGGSPTETAPKFRWWTTRVEDGKLTSIRNPPLWQDDPQSPDGIIDRDEVFYEDPDLVRSKSVPESLQNRAQTYDLYYQRDFGGRRYSGRWTAGARYFLYEGTVPASAWLLAGGTINGSGYSDGFAVPLLLSHQESTGWGPSGSAEFQTSFFRKRLVLYLQANAAFILEDLSMDSGSFFSLVRDQSSGELISAPAHLQEDRSQSVWHLGGEAGVRGRVAQGFDIYASWSITAYTDAILYPHDLLIPDLPRRIPLGTSALYKTRDLVYDQVMLGLAFQF
jgi:hypothetical protein